MTIAYLGGISAWSDPSPTLTGTLDTTGADCLIILVSSLATAPTITDSKSNTWGEAAFSQLDVDSVARLSFWICLPTSVGSGHTFTATEISGIMSISVLAFSGVLQVEPREGSVGSNNANSTTTLQTGNITPVDDGRLFIAGLMHYEDGVSNTLINSGFTLRHAIYSDSSDGSQHLGLFSATLIQITGAAVNPTWDWTGLSLGAAGLISLIPAAATVPPGDLRAWALGYGIGIGQLGAGNGGAETLRSIWYGAISIYAHRAGG